MKKILRMSVLSGMVLTAMAFSTFSAMAMASTPVAATPVASATATSGLKREVIGTVTAVNATSITINGTVYTLSATTQMQGAVQAGDTVKLEIVTNADGSLAVYEVAKPDASGSRVDVSGTASSIDAVGSVEPVDTKSAKLDKSNSVDPISTVEPVHTEVASPDKNSSTDSHLDKNSVDATPDKSGSSLDKSAKDAEKASGYDATSVPSQPEPVGTPAAPAGDGQ